MSYRKGDVWKIALLLMFIVAAFWFSFHNIMRARGPRRPGPSASQAQAPARAQEQQLSGEEMFAPRQRATSERLARAHAAPDPFRPYVSLAPGGSPEPADSPAPASADSSPAPAAPAAPFRLVGFVRGSHPLAVLVSEDDHHYVVRGDSLPDGWKVSAMDQRSVLLAKGSARVRLTMGKQS